MPPGSRANDDDAGVVLRALADSSRRQLLDLIKKSPGIHIADLEPNFSMSRFALMKHLNVLEEAGLIYREKEANTRKIFLEPGPLKLAQERIRGWI